MTVDDGRRRHAAGRRGHSAIKSTDTQMLIFGESIDYYYTDTKL